MIVVLSLAVLLAIGLAPVAVDLADEWFERRAWICDMERAWHPCEGRAPERPGRVRPVLLRLRRRVDRQIELLAAEEAWHERRVREVRRALCVWERRRDLVDARIELEVGR